MIQIAAPAKINWFLYVLNRRGDGYHNILSAMQKISLYDSLEIRSASVFQIEGDTHFEDNIMIKAADALKNYCGIRGKGMNIKYKKGIPVSAGLGGGSSDAAAVIASLNDLWGLSLRQEELLSLAGQIGSDVPFFLDGNFSIVEGRGELLARYSMEQSYDLLLVNPAIPISSGWAYKVNHEFMTVSNKDELITQAVSALQGRDYSVMAELMKNSLEGQVFEKYPIIGKIKQKMIEYDAVMSLMSGSGSTVFGVFPDRGSATEAQKRFGEYWTAVVRTLV